MATKFLTIIIILIALVMAIMATVWPQTFLMDVVHVSRFFDVMIPVLAVGALIKYMTK